MDWRLAIVLGFIGVVSAQKLQLRPSSAQLEPVTKAQNESYVVTCMTDSSDRAEWTGPRGKLPTGSGGRVHVEAKGTYGLVLMFDRLEVSDKGTYTCKVDNEKVSFNLTVIKVPQLKNTHLVQHVREFQTKVIKCEVEGEPKPVISWQRNGTTLEEKSGRIVPDTMGLKVINATKSDAGIYTCRALQVSSEASSIYTWDIRLKVQFKPEWKEPGGEAVKAYGYLTGETNLTCEAEAEPEANYTWSRINHSSKNLPLNSTEIREPGRSVLKMNVHNDSFGSYKCEAYNHLGRISRVFILSLGEKPTPPTGVRWVEGETTEHTATLKLASDTPDDELVGFRVKFTIARPGEEVRWERFDFQDVAKNDKGHYQIVDLLEDTPYAVVVATKGVAGLSDFTTKHVTLRTLKKGQSNTSWRPISELVVVIFCVIVFATVH